MKILLITLFLTLTLAGYAKQGGAARKPPAMDPGFFSTPAATGAPSSHETLESTAPAEASPGVVHVGRTPGGTRFEVPETSPDQVVRVRNIHRNWGVSSQ
jgi:hypothetical protein